MIIRYATAEDVNRHYDTNGHQRFGYRIRAVTAEHEGKIMGLAGVYYEGKTVVAFSQMSDEMKKHKKDIVRVTRMVMQMIYSMRMPVLALCEDESGRKFCEAVGFTKVEDTEHGAIMICQS